MEVLFLDFSMTVSRSSLEATSGTAASTNLLIINQDFGLAAQFFHSQFKSIACCQTISDWTLKKQKQYYGLQCEMDIW